jgi:hypothetical protein
MENQVEERAQKIRAAQMETGPKGMEVESRL